MTSNGEEVGTWEYGLRSIFGRMVVSDETLAGMRRNMGKDAGKLVVQAHTPSWQRKKKH